MSSSRGDLVVSTKVDAAMNEFIETEANRLGISRAELLRRLLEFYRDSANESVTCPWCDEPIIVGEEL